MQVQGCVACQRVRLVLVEISGFMMSLWRNTCLEAHVSSLPRLATDKTIPS